MVSAVSSDLKPLGARMLAIRFHGVGDLRLEELPVPVPGPGEVRIRPLAAGMCGTDIHIFNGEAPATPPVVLGHEVAGVVDAVRAGTLGIHEGDMVTLQPNTFCGLCRPCRSGREHLCSRLVAYGVNVNGGFAEAMVMPASVAHLLPAGMDPRIGCLAEPLACCVHGIDRLKIEAGSSVLVIGAGPIGLMLTRLSRLSGAALIVTSERDKERRSGALAFGADALVDPNSEDGSETIKDMTGGEGFDYVVDAVGSSATFEQSISLAAHGGKILVFGVAPMTASASVRPFDIYRRELTILGSFINPYTHERAVSLLRRMGLENLCINTYSLVQYTEAFKPVPSSGAASKVQIAPNT